MSDLETLRNELLEIKAASAKDKAEVKEGVAALNAKVDELAAKLESAEVDIPGDVFELVASIKADIGEIDAVFPDAPTPVEEPVPSDGGETAADPAYD